MAIPKGHLTHPRLPHKRPDALTGGRRPTAAAPWGSITRRSRIPSPLSSRSLIAAKISGSTNSHLPPASPQPIRGMWTEAPSSIARSPTATNAAPIALYRIGGPLVPFLMPCCPIMLATWMSARTSTTRTAPNTKPPAVPSFAYARGSRPPARPAVGQREDRPPAPPTEVVAAGGDEFLAGRSRVGGVVGQVANGSYRVRSLPRKDGGRKERTRPRGVRKVRSPLTPTFSCRTSASPPRCPRATAPPSPSARWPVPGCTPACACCSRSPAGPPAGPSALPSGPPG